MQKAEMVSVKTFVERLDAKGRESAIAYAMKKYDFTRKEAEEWYIRLRSDVIEAAILKGEVDPDLP